MRKFNIISLGLVIIVMGILVYIFAFLNKEDDPVAEPISARSQRLAMDSLPTKSNNEGDLSIDVTPLSISAGQSLQFEIAFNTHQGDLDFDLMSQSILLDKQGNKYEPLEWQGGRGGHHLSGVLIFPPLKKEMKQFKLIIKDIYGINERIFEWNLE